MADPFPAPTIKQPHQCEWKKGHPSRLVRACGANKNLFWILIPTPKSGGCFVLDPCGSACCATSLNQTYPRRSSTRSTALAASCPVASDSAGSPSKQVSAPETHPSPVAYSFSYIVVAYSASWSSYCSRPSFNSSSLRPRRSSGSIQLTLVSMLIGFLLLHVGNQNRIRFSTWLYNN